MRIAFALSLCAALGCNTDAPVHLPPPFGPGVDQTARLFFPTGLAVAGTNLLVANGNFDHAFDAGTVVSIDGKFLASVFDNQLDCGTPLPGTVPAQFPPLCDQQLQPAGQPSHVLGAVLIGNYAGPLQVFANGTETTAFTAARDTNTLHAVSVLADGSLQCKGAAPGTTDCRAGAVDLSKDTPILEGPYGIAIGNVVQPGNAAAPPQPVVFVGALVPHIDQILSGTAFTNAPVAAVDANNPGTVLFSMQASTNFVAGGAGVGPLVFDAVRRQLLMTGCYLRFPNGSQGQPATGRCNTRSNLLRVLTPDSGSLANVVVYDLATEVSSTDSGGMVLADEDPTTGVPRTLFETVRNADALLAIDLPTDPGLTPHVRHSTPLPVAPGELVRVRRPGTTDLLAVAAQRSGVVDIFDVAQDQVVAKVERLGVQPFTLVQLPGPAGVARLAVSIFGDCRLGLIEVPLDQPWNSKLRGRVGTCPP
jgi:hypothetical protein